MKTDLAIRGNAIFDSVREAPFRGYVLVSGSRIAAVAEEGAPGYDPSILAGAGRVIDAGDRLVMAGFHDSHTHLLMAGMFSKYVSLFDCKSEEETVDAVYRFEQDRCGGAACARGSADWIYGFGWYHPFWTNKRTPTKKSLDKVFPDRPVALLNAEAHGLWANSRALEIAGIDDRTADPFGGRIERDSSGEATGYLYENACALVTKFAYEFDEATEKELIAAFMKTARTYGITSTNDVMPYFHGNMGHIPIYAQMDKAGELTVRLHTAPDLLGDLDEVLRWQEDYTSDRLKVTMVKQFLDGVTTSHTALMLEPYTDDPTTSGTALFDIEAIKAAIPEAHRRGLSVKLHSCGDASLRYALDYYENAIKLHGKNKCRHAIEHCEYVSDPDMPRFGALGVIPSVQPEHLALTEKFADMPYFQTTGAERANKTWPLKSLLESAGVLAIGSDCPVVSNNPFPSVYRAITRTFNDGEPKGGWNPSQKLSLFEILRAYTWGSAYGVGREAELGTLEAGKFADLVVLDANPFKVKAEDIKGIRADFTIMDGSIVFERK